MRRIAVEIMTQSYVPPRTTMQYPLRKMVDLLAFESEAECASFLRAHGIESELEEVRYSLFSKIESLYKQICTLIHTSAFLQRLIIIAFMNIKIFKRPKQSFILVVHHGSWNVSHDFDETISTNFNPSWQIRQKAIWKRFWKECGHLLLSRVSILGAFSTSSSFWSCKFGIIFEEIEIGYKVATGCVFRISDWLYLK